MTDIAVTVEHLWKRFHRGEVHDSLRDLVPALALRLLGRGPRPDELRDGDFWALRDVSFEVRQGEALGIIGANGAGKSTLLKVLARLLKPNRGFVRVNGRLRALIEIAAGFHPDLTGRENIYLNGTILGMRRKEIDSRFDEIVEFAGIAAFLDTPVKRYSSGMYARLGFAVAAHLEPEILVVDEVLAVGDAAFQRKCLGRMDEVAKAGRTVLFVSHNMAAVAQLCQRALWLDGGEVRTAGDSQQVINAYLQTVSMPVAERRWSWPGDAPGDDLVRLAGARVLQQARTACVVDINQACAIEMDLQVLRPARNLIAAANFYSAQGDCLFCTADWRPNELAPGSYRKRLHVPPQLFNEGATSVLLQLVFYDPAVRSVYFRDALRFEAVDSDHPDSVRGHFRGEWPGAVRVKLDWGRFEIRSGEGS